MPTFTDSLTELIAAGYRLLYLHNAEEERALGMMRTIAAGASRQMFVYSPAAGFSGSDVTLWDTIDIAPDDSMILMLDAHLMLAADPLLGRRLRDRKPSLTARNIVVVMISPLASLPAELEHEVYLAPLPLPSLTELEAMLSDAAPEGLDAAIIASCAGQGPGIDGTGSPAGLCPCGPALRNIAPHRPKRPVMKKKSRFSSGRAAWKSLTTI